MRLAAEPRVGEISRKELSDPITLSCKRRTGTRSGAVTCPESHSPGLSLLDSRPPMPGVLYTAPPACLPLAVLSRSSSHGLAVPSPKPPQRHRCKYFPLGLQVSKTPFPPRSFRQFLLPFSKQIFILIKAFIAIIHLSLRSIRQ